MPSRRTFAYVLGTMTAAGVAALPTLAFPLGPSPFEITKSTIDSGGGILTGGVYEVHGTIGQPDAHAVLAGAVYELSGGFWAGGGPPCPWDCEPMPNGFVDISDLFALFGHWNAPGPCDFDGSGGGITDLFAMFGNWGPCP